MKKVSTIEVKAIPATQRKVEKTFCDIPDCIEEVKPSRYGWGKTGHQCVICKRDICKRHTVEDPDESGDYPDRFCTICSGLYLVARRAMNERHWKEEEMLLDMVKRQSLGEKMGPCPCMTCSGYCACKIEGHHA